MKFILETQLINLLTYAVGGFLYLLLIAEVGRRKINISDYDRVNEKSFNFTGTQGLLIIFGLLGCIWNFGQFFLAFVADFAENQIFIPSKDLTFIAQDFLPAVLVQIESEKQTNKKASFEKPHFEICLDGFGYMGRILSEVNGKNCKIGEEISALGLSGTF